MNTFRKIKDGDIEAVVKLWQACGLTRPWNDPYKDISFASRQSWCAKATAPS